MKFSKLMTRRNQNPSKRSPEFPTPIKQIDLDSKTTNDENQIDPIRILLANGQIILTNFEEKFILDSLLNSSTTNLDEFLQEKLSTVVELNFGLKTFRFDPLWTWNFSLKHFQSLVEHERADFFFERLFKMNFDQTNSNIVAKRSQIEKLFQQSSRRLNDNPANKRRKTARRLDFH